MAGRHRSTTQHAGRSTLKPAVWLLRIGLILALPAALGLLALGFYAAVTHKSVAQTIVIAVAGPIWLADCAGLARTLLRGRPRSPDEIMSVADKVLWLALTSLIPLILIGSKLGWANGPFAYVIIGIASLLVLCTLVGKRLLRSFLESRAASRPHPS
jgi:hypothetical protein